MTEPSNFLRQIDIELKLVICIATSEVVLTRYGARGRMQQSVAPFYPVRFAL